MDARTEVEAAGGQACDILSPARQSAPVVLASPHSSADYPSDFVVASRLDLAAGRAASMIVAVETPKRRAIETRLSPSLTW